LLRLQQLSDPGRPPPEVRRLLSTWVGFRSQVMFSNKLALAVGAACIVAAGAGGYLAQRQNGATSSTPLQASAGSSASAPGNPQPVQETEAIVTRPAPPAKPTVSPRSTTPPPAATSKREVTAGSRTARAETTAPVDRLPAGSAPVAVSTPIAQPDSAPPPRPLETVEHVAPEPALLQEPPQKSYEELVVSADSVIGLQSETTVTSDRARIEDRVEARVTRDVKVGNRVAIPAGSRAIGFVSQVERGGKFKDHGRLAVRFQTVVLPDGTRLPISTDAVIREGSSPGSSSAKKIGGSAVAGTILGAIIGGSKGAAIGGMAGAGAGTGMVAASDGSVATLHAGEPMTVRLQSPVTVVADR
jgi:hypothetical protein